MVHNLGLVEVGIQFLDVFAASGLIVDSVPFGGFYDPEVFDDAASFVLVFDDAGEVFRVDEESCEVVEALVDGNLDLVDLVDHL